MLAGHHENEELWVDLHQIWEDDLVLERLSHPDQVQRVLVNGDLLGKERGIVRAQEAASIWIDAEAEVSDSDFHLGLTDDVRYRRCDAGIDLLRVVCGRVTLVPEGDEEDAWYQG